MDPPSLQFHSRTKLAQEFCQEVRRLLQECDGDWLEDADNFEEMCELLNSIYKSKGVPYLLREDLNTAVRCTITEYTNWMKKHSEIFSRELTNFYYVRPNILFHFLIFRVDGTIDEYETAKKIVASNEIVAEKRFLMACIYCLRQDIYSIWSTLSDRQKESIRLEARCNPVIKHWYRCVKYNSHDIVVMPFTTDFRRILIWAYSNNSTALNFFFQKLTPADQDACLRLISERYIMEPPILYFEPFINNRNGLRTQMLGKDLRFTLRCYLKWPHQGKIYHLTEDIFQNISARDFYKVVDVINEEKLLGKWNDFNYKNLIIHFWNKTSPSVKMEIIKSGRYRGLDLGFFTTDGLNERKVIIKIYDQFAYAPMDHHYEPHTPTYSNDLSFTELLVLCFLALVLPLYIYSKF
ncbi:hypothetical protein AVEN_94958-1 [Araneus ventricosus]|uniref:Uncharacterized protein n=1 Tax=Araneus ventricosus TaxID=182803 RepID=A0A4Y2DKT5_ARAVE|nr:hypothetical protein AVEN_94958-1 [Araneus ventricosus]